MAPQAEVGIALIAVLAIALIALAAAYLSLKHSKDNDCVCVVDGSVSWPKGKGKDSPFWKNLFPTQ